MNEPEPFQCLMLGLPKTGKTTFLAALWHVLKTKEIPGSLLLERREGDQEYLNHIANQWSKCAELARTPSSGQTDVAIVLRDPTRDSLIRMSIPDMSGEVYAWQWEKRICDAEFVDIAEKVGGCIAFLHPGTLAKTVWIADANAVYDGWLADEESGQASVPAGLTTPETPQSATPWSPKDAPTQVQMVEVLQFFAELTSRHLRLALVVSAWDLVTENISPAEWVERNLPLLWQYLRTNQDQFETAYMGLSAQGGERSNPDPLLDHLVASHRIKVVAQGIDSHDITYPIRWLMSPTE